MELRSHDHRVLRRRPQTAATADRPPHLCQVEELTPYPATHVLILQDSGSAQ
jgi:hypothetical protein